MNQIEERSVTEPINDTPAQAADAKPVEAADAAPADAVKEIAAGAPAEAPKATVAKAAKPAVRAPGSRVFEAELAALLTQLYTDYDFQQVEGCPPGSRVVDFWALPAELKGAAAPEAGSERPADPKNRWPPRTSLAERPRDYRLHVYLSVTNDPAWGVPGKDVQSISTDRSSGLLLLMAYQKGFFLPSNRLWDLCQLFTPVQTSVFKITGPKLRKAAMARFFSLAGFARELEEALRK